MENKLTTIDISKTSPEELVEILQYTSYCMHRDRGMSHEKLLKVGFPNDYKIRYKMNT